MQDGYFQVSRRAKSTPPPNNRYRYLFCQHCPSPAWALLLASFERENYPSCCRCFTRARPTSMWTARTVRQRPNSIRVILSKSKSRATKTDYVRERLWEDGWKKTTVGEPAAAAEKRRRVVWWWLFFFFEVGGRGNWQITSDDNVTATNCFSEKPFTD